ncbi:MAG: primosomal protein N' [Deltaproteobacteria bacterium]|nr:primosomal protein N' [Deltaproteobacteria bacterium]
MQRSHIEVAIALPVFNTYTYGVPEHFYHQVSPGKRVLVPFGRRKVTGYILGRPKDTYHDSIKFIIDILDESPIFPSSMIPFFKWTADYYMHPLGEVIKSALPKGLNIYDTVCLAITEKGEKAIIEKSVTSVETTVLHFLRHGSCSQKKIISKLTITVTDSLINRMARQGLLTKQRAFNSGGRTKPKLERYVSFIDSGTGRHNNDYSGKKLSGPRKKIINLLKSKGDLSVKELKKIIPPSINLVRSMQKAGQVTIYKKKIYRNPFGESIIPDIPPQLTKEQRDVVAFIQNLFGKGYSTCLLKGVTGSGKTEVYLHLTEIVIKKGRSVVILVPEIALITQIEQRFRSRFGDTVALLHSGLSAGELYDQWTRILAGEAAIAIGARSAIFAPFKDIGLIVVDEEHDASYKQDGTFCYNARDLAVVRAKHSNGIALLGSATPSVNSYHNTFTGKYLKASLTRRVGKSSLPDITIVDLRKNRDVKGTKRFLSPELRFAMKETLERGEQILLFLNQRGFATHPVCAACGESLKCKNCSITLTLHKKTNAYRCHYCGYSRPSVSHCDICGSHDIKLLGFGTEKVEEGVKTFFPDARVSRMDRDTTLRKGSLLRILQGLKKQGIDILIGTQMIAKGHDFPKITLVGIICADLSLNFPDFRACENTYQLISQVSGRAGRGDAPGKVILQTYNPNHFSIVAAQNHDFNSFYDQEIQFRSKLDYPPFTRMIRLQIFGRGKEKTGEHAFKVTNICKKLKTGSPFFKQVQVLGPIEAPVPKIANKYRWHLLLKSPQIKPLHRMVQRLFFDNKSDVRGGDVKVISDIDPFFMM